MKLPESHTEIAARSFGSFSEATHAVLDVIEARLHGTALLVVQIDDQDDVVRVLAARGELPLNRRSSSRGAKIGMAQKDESAETGTRPHLDPVLELMSGSRGVEIGSYVGIPLELKDGTRAAILCAISRMPHRFDQNDLKLLETMGRVIANELDRERVEVDLIHREQLLVESNQRLLTDATTDPITNVANRRSFDKALTDEWSRCKANQSSSYLMILDLDDFKSLNDVFGHAVGDKALHATAQALVSASRQDDFVGRLGGDEFGVILVGCDSPDTAAAYRERARNTFQKSIVDLQITLSFSAGFHSISEASSPTQALEMADQAMYWQKRQRTVRPDDVHPTAQGRPTGIPSGPPD